MNRSEPPASCVVLAAESPRQVGSEASQIAQTLCGVPILGHLLTVVEALGLRPVTIIADAGSPEVEQIVGGRGAVLWQKQKAGSGAALLLAKQHLESVPGDVMVVYGNRPFLQRASLERLILEREKAGAACAVLSVKVDDPHGNGRVVRDAAGLVVRTPRDCDISEPGDHDVKEVVAGAYLFKRAPLLDALAELARIGAAETFMTDVVARIARKHKVAGVLLDDRKEAQGIYSLKSLAAAEAAMQERIFDRWLGAGVRILDPRTTVISADVLLGPRTVLHPHCVIDGPAEIGAGCRIGPFARIAGSVLGDGVTVGSFATVARSRVGDRARVADHASLADAEVASDVAVSAHETDGAARRKAPAPSNGRPEVAASEAPGGPAA